VCKRNSRSSRTPAVSLPRWVSRSRPTRRGMSLRSPRPADSSWQTSNATRYGRELATMEASSAILGFLGAPMLWRWARFQVAHLALWPPRPHHTHTHTHTPACRVRFPHRARIAASGCTPPLRPHCARCLVVVPQASGAPKQQIQVYVNKFDKLSVLGDKTGKSISSGQSLAQSSLGATLVLAPIPPKVCSMMNTSRARVLHRLLVLTP
jgi:hypothetical protein